MRPDIQVIACRDGVFLEQQSYEDRDLIRTDRLQAHDLNVDRLQDTWTAKGPGWVQSTGYQKNSGGLFGPTKKPVALAAEASAQRSTVHPSTSSGLRGPRSTQLSYLGIDFDRQVSGEIIRRITRFEGRVRAVYGPVADWEAQLDPNRPEWLGGEGFAMNCDQLTVSQMSPVGSEDAPYDLEASGNTVVEGALFTARSQRLTYAMAKDLLVLEGDGRSEAELFRRVSPEAADDRLAGGRILYWPKTQRGRVSDGSSLDLNDLTGLRKPAAVRIPAAAP